MAKDLCFHLAISAFNSSTWSLKFLTFVVWHACQRGSAPPSYSSHIFLFILAVFVSPHSGSSCFFAPPNVGSSFPPKSAKKIPHVGSSIYLILCSYLPPNGVFFMCKWGSHPSTSSFSFSIYCDGLGAGIALRLPLFPSSKICVRNAHY